VTREEVDWDALVKERELIERQVKAEGKPDHVVEKIVDGKIEAWYSDNVLYDQKFVNTERFDGTVGDMVGQLASKMGENISVRRISRIAVGE
jgi:elongation factor Ts